MFNLIIVRFLLVLMIGFFPFVNPVHALQLDDNLQLQLVNLPIHPHVMTIYCQILSGEDGIDACNLAIKFYPDNDTLWNNRGEKLFSLGRYDEALTSYNHALLISPEYSLVLANRCGVLSQLEKYSQALTSCKFALNGDQRWGKIGEALAWNNQGDVLFNLGRYQESLRSFDRALAIFPNNQSIRHNRELVIQQLGLIGGNHPLPLSPHDQIK